MVETEGASVEKDMLGHLKGRKLTGMEIILRECGSM